MPDYIKAIVVQVSLFLWAKIFPEQRRETKMIDSLEPRLISCFADSPVMCTTLLMWGQVTGDWQPRTGRQGSGSMPRTPDTHCLCRAPSSGADTLTRSRSRQSVPGCEYTSALGRRLQLLLETSWGADSPGFLSKKTRCGSYISVCKEFPQITFILGTKKCARWGLFGPYWKKKFFFPFSLPISPCLQGLSGSKIPYL